MSVMQVEAGSQLAVERQIAALVDERTGLLASARNGSEAAAQRVQTLDAQIAGLRSDLLEVEVVHARERAVGMHDVDELRAWLDRLPAGRVAQVVAARLEHVLGDGDPDERRLAQARRDLTKARAKRGEIASDGLIFGVTDGRVAQLAEVEARIAELERELNVQAAPAAKPDQFEEAIATARAELETVDSEAAALAWPAFQGDADALPTLATLDERRRQLCQRITLSEQAATQERTRADAVAAQAEAKEWTRLAAEADRLAEERDEALGRLADETARLAALACTAAELEAEAANAAHAAGRTAPNVSRAAPVLLAFLEHNGFSVIPQDAPLAAQRLRLVERYGGRARTEAQCTVCTHAQRQEIEEALADATQSAVAARFSVSTSSLNRHVRAHMARAAA